MVMGHRRDKVMGNTQRTSLWVMIIFKMFGFLMVITGIILMVSMILGGVEFIYTNFVKESSLYLKSSIGYIQMTGLVPTIFILFYTFIPVVTLILVLHNLLRRSKDGKEKGGT
jgi:uncharacterized membrane protein